MLRCFQARPLRQCQTLTCGNCSGLLTKTSACGVLLKIRNGNSSVLSGGPWLEWSVLVKIPGSLTSANVFPQLPFSDSCCLHGLLNNLNFFNIVFLMNALGLS